MKKVLAEVRVFSRRHRFAGTLDILGLWHGAGCLIDMKTGDPRDVGAWWQTAAYLGAVCEMLADGDHPDRQPSPLTFDPVPHAYALDGAAVPSVTQTLQASGAIDFSMIPQPILLAARDRGSAVHQACHYFNENDLDVGAFAAEFPEYWPYLSAWISFRRESGFEVALSFAELGDCTAIRRYAVQLRKDGTYRVTPYTDPRDYAEFLALLRAQEILAKHRMVRREVA